MQRRSRISPLLDGAEVGHGARRHVSRDAGRSKPKQVSPGRCEHLGRWLRPYRKACMRQCGCKGTPGALRLVRNACALPFVDRFDPPARKLMRFEAGKSTQQEKYSKY